MPQYNSTDKRTQTIGIEGFTESDIVLEVIGDTTFAGDVSLGDEDKIKLGDGNDLQIYHDSTFSNSIIRESGSGNLLFGGDNILFRDATLSELHARFITNNAVELYYDNAKKFETTTTGATTTGIHVADGFDLGDDDRLRFGDSQDLQIYHDSTFNNGVITETGSGNLLLAGQNIDFRDANFGDSYALFRDDSVNTSVELYYNNTKRLETTATGATTTGIHVADGFDAGDGERIRLGDAQDLQIYHDTTNSIIDTATGNLILSSANAVDIYNSSISEVRARFLNDGGVELYYDNAKKFETTATGATVTGVLVADGVDVGDDDRIRFGDAQDLQIWHNSTNNNSVIQENGTGDLNILANDLNIRNQAGNETIAQFKQDAEVSLNYDNIKKFETTATGATTTGIHVADGFDAGDGERIRLGDSQDLQIYHSGTDGVITNTTGDLIITNSEDSKDVIIRTDNGSGGIVAYIRADGSTGEVQLSHYNAQKLATSSTGVTVTGIVVADGVDVGDSEKLRLGDSQDLEIYHDGTHSYITDVGTGNLYIGADQNILLTNPAATEFYASFNNNGAVELYYDNTKRLETTATGATTTGIHVADGFDAGDNERLRLGDGNDFQFYHDGSNSYIVEGGTGLLNVDSSYLRFRSADGTKTFATFTHTTGASGGVQLYYDNSKKFETTSTGADVTGTFRASTSLVTTTDGTGITITNNTIQGPSTLTIDPAAIGDNTGTVVIAGDLQIDGTTTTVNSTTMTVDDKNLELGTGAANDAAADGGGITVVSGDGNKTFQFEATGDNLGSSENLNLANTKEYKINNTSVLSATTLGTAVVNSSLTSVGTIGTGTWQGTAINDDYIGTIDNANKVALTALDIDGGTAATALTADDLFIIDDGAAGTNRSITAALAKDYFASDVTSINLANEATDTETFLTFATAATGAQALKTNANLTFNSNTGALSASTYIGTLTNTLTLGVSGNGLSGSATYNNSAATTFTVTSNATSANTASTIVFRDASGNFSANTITGSVLVSNVATGTAPLTVTSTTLVSNLNADLLDGQQGSFYLNTGTTFGGDVSGTYNAIQVTNDSHTHQFNNLTDKTSGTGNYSTNGYLESGRGSGGVALTINDGYGNANVTFNHRSGTPEQTGKAGRIEVNTDSTTGAATMSFELGSATASTPAGITQIMQLSDGGSTFTSSAGLTFNNRPAFNGGASGSTAPFTVDSTDVVTNLNADLLDGQQGTFYTNASNIDAGTLAIARGGTNGSATPTAGGAAYGTGTAYAFTAAGTSGQVLTSNGASAPTWQDVAVAATDESTDTTCFPLFATDATGAVTLKTDASGLTYDSANERLQATDVTVKGAVRCENSASTERFEILYNETTDSLDFSYFAS